MGVFDAFNGEVSVSSEIRNLSDRELIRIHKTNPYNWSIMKMSQVAQEIKNRGLEYEAARY